MGSPAPSSPGSWRTSDRRRRRRLLLVLLLVVAAWVSAVLGLQRLLVFPSYAAPPDPRAGRGVPGLVRLALDAGDGEVEAWLLPGHGVSAERPGPAVIFAHGNAELIDYWAEPMAEYRAMGVTVLLPEYRGYGRSAGRPSEQAITADFVRFHDMLAARPEVDRTRIVFHGRSLGGGVVCALALRRKPAALVLQSTFRSVAVLARRYLLPRALVLDPFDNEAALARLRDVRTLIVHGRRDTLIPFAHAETLARIPERARLVEYDADHNDCPPDWSPFWTEIRTFLTEASVL